MNFIIFKLVLVWFFIIPKSLTDSENMTTTKSNAKSRKKFEVHFMETNTTYYYKPVRSVLFEKRLNIFCYRGVPKSLERFLESIELQLEIENDDFTQYEGGTPEEVDKHFSQHQSILNINLFTQKRSRLSLSPFAQKCIGIETWQPYSVTLYQQKTDYYLSIQLISGILMFLFARILSRNTLFYYITVILFGICSSFLLLIWLTGILIPRRIFMYGMLIGGWTIGFYAIRMLWNNIQMITMTYRSYVCWYIFTTGLISFFLCYRWGPPRNRRTKNIMKWLLQLISLVVIYFSSYLKEATIAIIVMAIILQYFSKRFKKTKNLSASTKNCRKCVKQPKSTSNGNKEPEKDCQKESLNGDKQKDDKVTHISELPCLINSTEEEDISDQHVIAKNQLIKSDYKSYNANSPSNSDVSLEEQEIAKQQLYPLPDGSFILSEKPPIILTPRNITPLYHRSTRFFFNDDEAEGDYTPKSCTPISKSAAQLRRLTSASSTSNLLFAGSGLAAASSLSQHKRSSSAQQMLDSCKMEDSNSKSKIKIQTPSSEDES